MIVPLLATAAALSLALDDPKPLSPADVVAALETAVSDAIGRAELSVVAISRYKSADGKTQAIRNPDDRRNRRETMLLPNQLDPDSPNAVSFDYGSGVVIGDRGEILTAYHVVKGAARLEIRAPRVNQFHAEIIAADPRSDLAVIAPLGGTPEEVVRGLVKLSIGKAETLRKGAFLLALGNPYNAARNDGRASASWGILANVGRSVNEPIADGLTPPPQFFRHFPTLLQLDSKLNLGMSGGAVVNLKGELVAITTAAADAPGYDAQAGYAIPMDVVGRRAVGLLAGGREVEYGFIGIKLSAPPNPANQVGGITPGTPAEQAGLQVGDLIQAVGETPVENVKGGINLALATSNVGQPVLLKVLRDGKVREIRLMLSKYPVEGEVIATNRPGPWRGMRIDFSTVLGGTTYSDRILEALVKGGVGVVEVAPGSAADNAGIKPGQIITEVDGTKVHTPDDFRKVVADRKGAVKLKTELGEITVR